MESEHKLELNFFDKLEGWKRNAIVAPQSGTVSFRYWYKKKKANYVQLLSPLAKKLAGYTLIERDLRTVRSWLEQLETLDTRETNDETSGIQLLDDERESDSLVKGLFLASVIFYGKCFAQAKGRRVKLERNQVPEELQYTHDGLMKMRHNYAAHSGDVGYERCQVNLVIHPKKTTSEKQLYIVRETFQAQSVQSSSPKGSRFVQLVDYMNQFAREKILTLNNKLFEDEINPHGIEYWRSLGR